MPHGTGPNDPGAGGGGAVWPAREALTGLAVTGGVITAAGAVLAGTFATLGTLPVAALAEIGFAVAFGVLLDTIIIRSGLVTALNLDLGRWMWWPGKLAREPVIPELEPETVASRRLRVCPAGRASRASFSSGSHHAPVRND